MDVSDPGEPIDTTDETYEIIGSINSDADDVTITIYDGATPVGSDVVAAGNTAWSIVVDLEMGDNDFTVTAEDASNNIAGPANVPTITTPVLLDKAIQDIQIELANISWLSKSFARAWQPIKTTDKNGEVEYP